MTGEARSPGWGGGGTPMIGADRLAFHGPAGQNGGGTRLPPVGGTKPPHSLSDGFTARPRRRRPPPHPRLAGGRRAGASGARAGGAGGDRGRGAEGGARRAPGPRRARRADARVERAGGDGGDE